MTENQVWTLIVVIYLIALKASYEFGEWCGNYEYRTGRAWWKFWLSK